MEKNTMTEVLDLLGIPFFPKGTNTPLKECPFCGKKGNKCYINVVKNQFYAHCCGRHGSPLSFYMEYRGIDSPFEAGKMLREELGGCCGTESRVKPVVYKPAPEEPQAREEVKDKTYRGFIEISPLSNEHVRDMLARGVRPEEVKSLGYGTYTYKDSTARVLQGKGLTLAGVPGFWYSEKDQSWLTAKNMDAIIVPYLNERRMITGIQLRKNSSDIERLKKKGIEVAKYSWLSSIKNSEVLPRGCSQHSVYHFACDWMREFRTGEYSPILGKKVRLTEGGMKADIIHLVTGEPVLAVAGVNCCKAVVPALAYCKAHGVTTIVDTFDMDYISNDKVASAMEKLKAVVKANGLEYVREDWEVHPTPDVSLKGYDDYVTYMRDHK